MLYVMSIAVSEWRSKVIPPSTSGEGMDMKAWATGLADFHESVYGQGRIYASLNPLLNNHFIQYEMLEL